MTQENIAFRIAYMASIHDRINERRVALKMSMESLAAEIGCTWQTIQQWENGKTAPSRKRLPLVAKALQTTTAYLQGNTDIIEPHGKPTKAGINTIDDGDKAQIEGISPEYIALIAALEKLRPARRAAILANIMDEADLLGTAAPPGPIAEPKKLARKHR